MPCLAGFRRYAAREYFSQQRAGALVDRGYERAGALVDRGYERAGALVDCGYERAGALLDFRHRVS